jgi:hypothetical protein
LASLLRRYVIGRGAAAVLTASALVALFGCGLSEYEEKMERSQQRIDDFDRDNQFLGNPIELPTKKNEEGKPLPQVEIFLRPPRKVVSQPKADMRADLLYRYPGNDPFIEMDVATLPEKDNPPGTLWKDVVAALGAPDAVPKTEQKQATGRPPRMFDAVAFTFDQTEPGISYYVYATTGGGFQVAIVYVVPKMRATNPEATTAIDLSLKSLGLGQEVGALKRNWKPR